jgi:hypothetical protein
VPYSPASRPANSETNVVFILLEILNTVFTVRF